MGPTKVPSVVENTMTWLVSVLLPLVSFIWTVIEVSVAPSAGAEVEALVIVDCAVSTAGVKITSWVC